MFQLGRIEIKQYFVNCTVMIEADSINEDKYGCIARALSPKLQRLRGALHHFCRRAPQCLLLEGGNEHERLAMAYWWAALLNCDNLATQDNVHSAPCLNCANCLQILNQCHNDIFVFDGRISNKDDLVNQGSIRAFNIDNIRNLKSILSNCPSHASKRVVVLMGLELTRIEAANALLKVLEEPSTYTVFVLLAAQREQLLPTLVSRSWVLTLPWSTVPSSLDNNILEWETALGDFLMPPGTKGSGHGWLTKTSKKNAVDAILAHNIIQSCQKALVQALIQTSNVTSRSSTEYIENPVPNASSLIIFFTSLTDEQRFFVIDFLSQCQEALTYAVNPARVMDWLATQLYSLHV